MEFIDLKAQYLAYKSEIDSAMQAVINNARFIGGSDVDCFEEELATYVGRKFCISCGSGTEALQLAFMAYGIGSGDAVFCPDMTFVSSVEPAVMLGATPVFVDIEEDSYNIDPLALEFAIQKVSNERKLIPKAVVAVDFLGNPANWDELIRICNANNLILIEDAAQGMGGSYRGRKIGAFGDIATTSFFPSKPLGCYGDGGAVFTDNEQINELIRSIKVHGKGESKYDNVRIGINSRLDNLQAAVLRVKLRHLDEELERRQIVARAYNDAFRHRFVLPRVNSDCVSTYAQYALLGKDLESTLSAVSALTDVGIPTLSYYPKCMHQMDVFSDAGIDEDYPVSVSYAQRNFALPFSAFITREDQNKVIEALS